MSAAQPLTDQLRMDHLATATEEELREAAQKSTDPETVEADKHDPRLEEEWTFQFNWKDGRGKVWGGEFTNKILNVGEKQAVAGLEATYAGGHSFDAIRPHIRDVNMILAHLSLSLINRPAWAKNLRGLTNDLLLFRLWEEVASHEATFHGLETGEGESK